MRLVPVGRRLSIGTSSIRRSYASQASYCNDCADPPGKRLKATLGRAPGGVDDFALRFIPLCLN
jgi:hypothetical protein